MAFLGTACAPEAPNLVVISLDTLRADHLGVYGYQRPTSPTLDALARESVVFDHAMTQMPTTGPSHFTLLTGLYPHSHGIYRNGQKLPRHLMTLGKVLATRGYDTAGFISGLPLIDELSDLGASFRAFDDDLEGEGFQRRDGAVTIDRALSWLQRGVQRPYFLFVHLFDAHGPYVPPDDLEAQFHSTERGPWASRIPRYQRVLNAETGGIITDTQFYVDRYDASIRYLDSQLARLFSAIDFGKTVVLVVSDHGETLADRRLAVPLDHGFRLVEEQIRIVALLRAPGLAAQRIDGLVGMIDFAPTLLGLLGQADALSDHEGRDLSPDLADGTAGKRAEFSACTVSSNISEKLGFRVDESKLGTAVRVGDTKLVSYPAEDGSEILFLYDLSTDPGELSEVRADPDDPEVKSLLDLMERWNLKRHDSFPTDDVPEEFKSRLESLGYIF